jgi:hypothetical protein
MQKKKSLISAIFLCLVLFSSFTPKPSGNYVKDPRLCEVIVDNFTNEVLTSISVESSTDVVTLNRIRPGDGAGAPLKYDDVKDDIFIYITFNTVPANAVATISTSAGVAGTVNIVAGTNKFILSAPVSTSAVRVDIQ